MREKVRYQRCKDKATYLEGCHCLQCDALLSRLCWEISAGCTPYAFFEREKPVRKIFARSCGVLKRLKHPGICLFHQRNTLKKQPQKAMDNEVCSCLHRIFDHV